MPVRWSASTGRRGPYITWSAVLGWWAGRAGTANGDATAALLGSGRTVTRRAQRMPRYVVEAGLPSVAEYCVRCGREIEDRSDTHYFAWAEVADEPYADRYRPSEGHSHRAFLAMHDSCSRMTDERGR